MLRNFIEGLAKRDFGEIHELGAFDKLPQKEGGNDEGNVSADNVNDQKSKASL
jgi:hypothetical protein